MLNLFRDASEPPRPVAHPPSGPDYESLADVLINLQPPDNAGEILINPDEAAAIRRTGWSARPGVWRAPLVPWQYIAPYRWLWHLDAGIHPAERAIPWRAHRSTFRHISVGVSKDEIRILRTLRKAPNGRLTREALLCAVAWRIPAAMADAMLARLASEKYITISADGYISPNY
jgi:hypothetical protein